MTGLNFEKLFFFVDFFRCKQSFWNSRNSAKIWPQKSDLEWTLQRGEGEQSFGRSALNPWDQFRALRPSSLNLTSNIISRLSFVNFDI